MQETIEPVLPGPALSALLRACDLDPSDLGERPGLELVGIRDGSELVAAVGLEHHGATGLLRSLAVTPTARGRGLGRRLVAHAEARARAAGAGELYLLTETAAGLFEGLGYARVGRDSAPAAIRDTPQFASLCPASATCMHKRLDAAGQDPVTGAP